MNRRDAAKGILIGAFGGTLSSIFGADTARAQENGDPPLVHNDQLTDFGMDVAAITMWGRLMANAANDEKQRLAIHRVFCWSVVHGANRMRLKAYDETGTALPGFKDEELVNLHGKSTEWNAHWEKVCTENGIPNVSSNDLFERYAKRS